MLIEKPTAAGADQCLELTAVNVSQSCPVGFNTLLSVSLRVTAHTSRTGLQWRRAPDNTDVVTPGGGDVSSNGVTEVVLGDLALDSELTLEVVDGATVLLRFTVRHY